MYRAKATVKSLSAVCIGDEARRKRTKNRKPKEGITDGQKNRLLFFLLHGVHFLLGCFHCCLVRVSGVRRLNAADTFDFGTVIFEP